MLFGSKLSLYIPLRLAFELSFHSPISLGAKLDLWIFMLSPLQHPSPKQRSILTIPLESLTLACQMRTKEGGKSQPSFQSREGNVLSWGISDILLRKPLLGNASPRPHTPTSTEMLCFRTLTMKSRLPSYHFCPVLGTTLRLSQNLGWVLFDLEHHCWVSTLPNAIPASFWDSSLVLLSLVSYLRGPVFSMK